MREDGLKCDRVHTSQTAQGRALQSTASGRAGDAAWPTRLPRVRLLPGPCLLRLCLLLLPGERSVADCVRRRELQEAVMRACLAHRSLA